VAVAGATGALGRELVAVLEGRRFPVRELLPFATDRSLGEEIEFRDELIPVATEPPRRLDGIQLLFVCTPAEPALAWVRSALRAAVPCLDASGVLAGSNDVPLAVAGITPGDALRAAPVVTAPGGPGLAWALALEPLRRAAGLRRVVGTVLRSASCAGRGGLGALSSQTIALLNQQEPPPDDVFAAPVAFDVLPSAGSGADAPGPSETERALQRELGRLFPGCRVSATAVQVPTFVGDGSALWIETERALGAAEAAQALAKAPGVELWPGDEPGPSTRDASGREVALVGRVRADAAAGAPALALWIAADAPRLAAGNLVSLAQARFELE
jgi:aspartate-semialdehyde dehydrogenase